MFNIKNINSFYKAGGLKIAYYFFVIRIIFIFALQFLRSFLNFSFK